jgi:hypothetical protein
VSSIGQGGFGGDAHRVEAKMAPVALRLLAANMMLRGDVEIFTRRGGRGSSREGGKWQKRGARRRPTLFKGGDGGVEQWGGGGGGPAVESATRWDWGGGDRGAPTIVLVRFNRF